MCSRSSRDLHQLSIVHHCQTTRVYRTDKIELVIGNLSTPTVVSLRRMDPTDPHSHGYSLSLSLIASVGSCSSNKTDPVVIYYLHLPYTRQHSNNLQHENTSLAIVVLRLII